MSDAPPRLALTCLVKEYPGVTALDEASLTVAAGEIVGLVGHNGAGKSTIAKIVAGLERPDAGEIAFDGQATTLRSANDAIHHGVGLVPQRLAVVSTLSVRDNLTLGARTHKSSADVDLNEIAADLGIDAVLDKPAGRLGPAAQRLVTIGRALLRAPRLLILDEPSAAFSQAEVDRLFDIVRNLRSRGISVIHVSHRLEEVLALVDRVVAMAQGRVIADCDASTLSKPELTDLIAGRHVEESRQEAADADAKTVAAREVTLRCRGVEVAPKLRAIDLELRKGEVIGITGLVGSGRTSLLNALWGVHGQITAGTVEVAGAPFRPRTPRDAMRRGIAYVPEDRGRNSLVKSMTVTENVTLPSVRRYRAGVMPWMRRGRERRAVGELTTRLNVRPEGCESRQISTLSGGNQQKAIIARWLMLDADIFLFDEPTEGVDVGGREDIYATIGALADQGRSVLVSSSDVEEVVEQCSRVLIMRDGTIADEIAGDALTVERVSRACIG